MAFLALPAILLLMLMNASGAWAVGDSWVTRADAPATLANGLVLVAAGSDTLYATNGGTTNFYRYMISANTWDTRTSIPSVTSNGASMVWTGGDSIYLNYGGNANLTSYSISRDTWSNTNLASAPASIGVGGAMAYPSFGGDYIYALRGFGGGSGSDTFWRYSISGNTWETKASIPAAVSNHGALTAGGSDTLFALQGNNGSNFYAYSISTNTWTQKTSATNLQAQSGTSMAYDSGNFIYVLMANSGVTFWRYSISGDTWVQKTSIDASISNVGRHLVSTGYGDSYLYALGSSATVVFRRYEIAVSSASSLVRSNNHLSCTTLIPLSKPFEVAVKDADGNPISGKTVAFAVSYAPSGSSGYSLDTLGVATSTASGTAAARLTPGNKNGVYQVTATSDTVTVTFTAYTDAVDITAGKWRMGGPNKTPNPSTLAGVIEDDGFGAREPTGKGTLTSGYRVYRWDPTASPDADFSRFKVPSSAEVGKSYWFKAAAAGTLDVDGTVVTDTFNLRLEPGWNMVASPFAYFIDWDSDVRFETFPVAGEALSPKTPGQARSDSIADDVTFWYEEGASTLSGYRWGPRSISYGAPLVTSLQLKPWMGYWVYAHKSCTMVFYPNPRDPSGGSSVLNQAPRYLSAVYGAVATGVAEEWTIQLSATGENQTYVDEENFIGVRRSGSLSVRDAPAAPGGVSLSVSRYGEGGRYALLYQGTGDPIWEIESYSANAGDVTIAADNVVNVPSGVPLKLRDDVTGAVTDLRAAGSYSYPSAAGETRRLTLSASVAGFTPSSAKVLYPSACLLTKFFSIQPTWVRMFRQMRDLFLMSASGRRLVSVYYGL